MARPISTVTGPPATSPVAKLARMQTTKDRLVQAAVDHLESDGLPGLTLREIARAAGVSHGTPARHFPSLAAMLATVAARSFVGLSSSLEQAVEEAGEDPLARLSAAGSGYVRFAIANANSYELMFRPELLDRTQPDYQEAAAFAFDQLTTLVVQAQSAGWRREANTETLTALLWSSVHGMASLAIQGALHAATGSNDIAPLLDLYQSLFTRLANE